MVTFLGLLMQTGRQCIIRKVAWNIKFYFPFPPLPRDSVRVTTRYLISGVDLEGIVFIDLKYK